MNTLKSVEGKLYEEQLRSLVQPKAEAEGGLHGSIQLLTWSRGTALSSALVTAAGSKGTA